MEYKMGCGTPVSYCQPVVLSSHIERSFGSVYSAPKYKQKVGEVLTYVGDISGYIETSDSISSVSIQTFQEPIQNSMGTVTTNVVETNTNYFELTFDSTNQNLLPGEEYLVNTTVTMTSGNILLRSFRVCIVDYFGQVPTSNSNCSVPAYVSVQYHDNTCPTPVEVQTNTPHACCPPPQTSNVDISCYELENESYKVVGPSNPTLDSPAVPTLGNSYTLENNFDELGVSITRVIPPDAGFATIDFHTPVEVGTKGISNFATNGIADYRTGDIIGIDNIGFSSFVLAGINGSDNLSFTVKYYKFNPYS